MNKIKNVFVFDGILDCLLCFSSVYWSMHLQLHGFFVILFIFLVGTLVGVPLLFLFYI